MPRPPSREAVQISFRLSREWIARADDIAAQMGRPGLKMTRTSVLRMALAEGLTRIERSDSTVDRGIVPAAR